VAILFSVVTAGCAKKVEVPKDSFYEEWRALAEKSQPSSPPDKKVSVDLPQAEEALKAKDKEIAEPKPIPRPLPTVPVSMTMRDTDVNVILRGLARIADQNIMMNKEVSGVTNINVVEAPWNEVFEGILRTRGLTYTWEGNIIRVMTLADMERDIDIESRLQAQQAQSIERKQSEPLLTEIIKIDYADAEALAANLNTVLTSSGQSNKDGGSATKGSITVNKHNNALIVEAISEDLAKIITLINKLDRPTSQVLIEARIVETTREAARDLGIKWGGFYKNTEGDRDSWITPGANTGEFGVGGPGPAANFPAEFTSTTPIGSGFTLGYLLERPDKYLLDIQLSALEEEKLSRERRSRTRQLTLTAILILSGRRPSSSLR
jgi:type IV pilus assembly protein PilQ